jgi:hypothetical protein
MNSNKQDYKKSIPIIADDLFGLSNSTDFSKMADKLYSENQIKMITELTGKQISKITRLYALAKQYDVPMLKEMCDTFIELRVSKDREGRKEAVNMAQAIIGMKRLDALEKMIETSGGKK